MKPTTTQVIVAMIGALGLLGGAWLTGTAAASNELNDVKSDQRVLKNTEELHYTELKGLVSDQGKDIKEILRAVK